MTLFGWYAFAVWAAFTPFALKTDYQAYTMHCAALHGTPLLANCLRLQARAPWMLTLHLWLLFIIWWFNSAMWRE